MSCSVPDPLDPPFKETFNSAVERAMLLLGESGKQATCYHLEKTFRLKRDAWHKNPEAFAEAVEQMFGSGSQLLLKAVVKELYTTLGLKFQESNQFSFVHLVRQAQRYSGGGGEEFN